MKFSQKEYFGPGSIPIGIGAVLKGWDLTDEEMRNPARLPVVSFRLMANACPLKCRYCFAKRSDRRVLTLDQIKQIVNKLAPYKPRAITLEEEGEPTIDPRFFDIIERIVSKDIGVVIFTEASVKLRNQAFVRRLYELGVSICPKVNSLFDPTYENWIVGDKKGNYFQKRNEALAVLMAEGFNGANPEGTTRLGFDVVVTKNNLREVPRILRFCRTNNLWVDFSSVLPVGRGAKFDASLALTKENKKWLKATIAKIDKEEFGFKHKIYSDISTGPCVEFISVWNDGAVSVCPSSEEKIGNILRDSVSEIYNRLLLKFPKRDPRIFDGHCHLRSPL